MVTSTCFVDGKPQAALALNDRGLNYGHGVFETMRLSAGQLPLWHYHCQRLSEGAERLGIALDLPRLQAYLQQALAAFPAAGIVKLLLTAGVGPRGYRQQDQASSYVLQYFPLAPVVEPAAVRLQICQYTLPHNARLAGIKHLNRLDQVLAAAELDAGFDGLLLDVAGDVVEALSSNVFIFDGRRWLTPALTLCGVAGVMRRLLCEKIIPEFGHKVVIQALPLNSLLKAEEIFVCNSVQGVQPVSELVGEARWSAGSSQLPGSETQKVIASLAEVYPCFAA
ncbi:aminodeoxychorismate lyase [Gammaproteobacteria bacterium 53_120_T64]|nr:aminodeoxychorismate lyase [Gammaproteobacteria bacterium 53_120_T64]